MPKPIVEALLLVREIGETTGGLPVLNGIVSPLIVCKSFPSEYFQWHVWVRLRGIQSPKEAERLELSMTHGLEGKEFSRQTFLKQQDLVYATGDTSRINPALAVSSCILFPRFQAKDPCILVYRILFDNDEIARTMIEFVQDNR